METLREKYPYIGIEERDVRYLGYSLGLTPREYRILRALLEAEGSLLRCEICRLAGTDGELKEKSVAVHICAINKKAAIIGGRRLVECSKRDGYFINGNA